MNDLKSMTEIINVLKDELKYDGATKQDRLPNNVCEAKPKISALQCDSCSELDNQLKLALNELSSVKLITEILNEEIKILKQTSHINFNPGNTWSTTKSSNSRCPATVRPPKEVHATHGIRVTSQHAVPVANQYSVLTNHYESQEPNNMIFSSNSEQPTRSVPVSNHKYVKGLRRKNTLPVNQPRLQIKNHQHKPNLQEPMNNEDGACSIPALVNGITSVNPNPKTALKYNESTGNLINKLRETINVYNKEKCSRSKKHRVILIGDSNFKGYVCKLKPLLSSNYELYSVMKPGSTTNELKEKAKKDISQLSYDDLIVICSGTNGYELNELSLTLQNITNFVKNNNHTNIILMNVPFLYDLPNSISVKRNISILNRKLQKLVKVFPHARFLEIDNNRNLFTDHGLCLNKLGKQLVNRQIASLLLTTFEQKSSSPIILRWHETQNDNN